MPAGRRIGAITLVVRTYDEAIAWYRDCAGFRLVADTPLAPGKRWVLMSPGDGGTDILLAEAATPEQESAIGRQTGGRVFLFLHTPDFEADHARMKSAGVRFLEEPRHETYGTVAVFEDLYGNRWDLIQVADAV
jgi:catechol 2,3-dioxygenase-like lactoylglutathione lyase family enzyme